MIMSMLKKNDYSIITKIFCVIGLLAYRIILDYAFCRWIAPAYSYYMQLKYVQNNEKVWASFGILLVLLTVTRFDEKYLSNVLLSIQLIVMLIPMLTLYAYSDRSTKFILAISGAYIVQALIIFFDHRLFHKLTKIKVYRSGFVLFGVLGVLLGAALLYTLFHYGIPTLAALHLDEIYSIRGQVGYSFPFSYIVPWVFKVICMYILIIGIYEKNIALMVIGFLAQFYFFLTYANKSTIFSLALVIGCYIIVSKLDVIKTIIMSLSSLIVLSGMFYVLTGNIAILSYLVRRTLFVPATIRFAYYDFFSANKLLHFADNSVGHLLGIQSPYSLEAPKLIAEYLGVPDSHCNTGYWGDAYANFGMAGVFIFSIILILFILFIEKMTEKVPRKVIFPIMITLFYNLNDAALLTWLLGGGGGLILLLLWLYRDAVKDRIYVKQIQKNNI